MHTLVYLILPRNVLPSHDAVARILDGSTANPDRIYPEYPVRCFCIGYSALMESFERYDTEHPDIILQLRAADLRKDREAREVLITARFQAVQLLEQAHPAYQQRDPDCDVCGGTGIHMQSRDPARHWDWWEIGGRWQGLCSPGTIMLPEAEAQLDGNIALASDLRATEFDGAIITPEGYWYEGPTVIADTLFAPFRPEHELAPRRSWSEEAQGIQMTYADHLVVLVDTHF